MVRTCKAWRGIEQIFSVIDNRVLILVANGMKDPLQFTPTPYDILGVPINADKSEIEKAFKESFKVRNFREAAQARSTLNKPAERAFIDLFLYNEAFMQQLTPAIGEDGAELIKNRVEIAKAWSGIQKKLFPHIAVSHSLALLWYWWAIYREEEQWALVSGVPFERRNLAVTAAPKTLWSQAIGHWVFLINSEAFWNIWIESKKNGAETLNEETVQSVRQRLGAHFIDTFHKFSERYRTQGDSAAVQRYQEYELCFSTEMRTAQTLKNEQLTFSRNGTKHVVCCGRIMLERVGMLGLIRKQLEEVLSKNPQHENLKKVAAGLSPHMNIAVLIDNNKFDEALQALAALPTEEQGETEIRRFRARSYLEKGNQLFSLDRFEDALAAWRNGLAAGELGEDIREAIVSQCKAKAVSLQKTDPGAAIELLERAIRMSGDSTLNEMLSSLYLQRGIDLINRLQQEMGGKPNAQKHKPGLEKGIMDIEKAVALDPDNSRARQQLQEAKNVLASFDLAGVVDDINAKNWKEAVRKLKKVVASDPKNSQAKELLAVCENQLCWFCRKRKQPPSPAAAVEVKMYRVTGQEGFQIQWQSATVTVPRCEACKKYHEHGDVAVRIGCLCGGALGVGACVAAGTGDLLGFVVFLLVTVMGSAIGMAFKPKEESHPLTRKDRFPVITQLKNDGWAIGAKPPGIQ